MRITSFRPRLDPKRGNVVTITLVARGVDDVQQFMENLEKTGAFPELFPPSERTNEQGQLETVIEAVYAPKQPAKSAAAPEPETGGPAGDPLARRIFAEKRRVIVPLGIAIVANVLLYALVVYPSPCDRRERPTALRPPPSSGSAAERELQVARGLITGKAQAEEELDAFYKKVLPANVSAARSLTYVPVVEIARRNDVDYVNRVYEDPEELHPEDSRRLGVSLKRLTTRVVLQGDYESIRAFIYELEQAPQFVVIDQVTLLEAEEGEPVTLTVTLSTFYREANAA